MKLLDTLSGATIVITCGPGGIGKTTSAAALASAMAVSSNRRVLVVTVDPARRLADALGIPGIGNEPVRVPTTSGELSVAMLDPQASWDALIRRQAPDGATAERILRNVLYQNITRRFVQSHDYIAMERLYELVQRDEWDLIVVDTPPTRNALDFLDAPSRMADFFSSRFLKWLIAPSRASVTTLAARPLMYIADRILGAAFLADITEFFLLLNSMYDGFVERARQVSDVLRRDSTRFVVVSTSERIPVTEASFFDEELRRRDLRVAGWLVNRLLPPSLRGAEVEREVRELRAQQFDDVATARVRDLLCNVTEEWHRRALDEMAVVATLASGPTPVFGAETAEGQIDTFEGVVQLGQQILTAESF